MSATNDEKTDVHMSELNVLCDIADYSSQSGQPVAKHLTVEITSSPPEEE